MEVNRRIQIQVPQKAPNIPQKAPNVPQKAPNSMNPKKFIARHIIIKISKNKDKSSKQKATSYLKRTPI